MTIAYSNTGSWPYPLEVPRIVAIGGGEIGRLETLKLDAEVIGMAAKERPKVPFVPTATGDDPGYVAIVEEHYGRRLGCDVSPLLLHDRALSDGDVRDDEALATPRTRPCPPPRCR